MTRTFELTMAELRAVARFAVESAETVLTSYEETYADDPRPRAAVNAAWEFVNGAPRTKLQRVAALDAHRAAAAAGTEIARLAARAAGDAAAAAYLHPLANGNQVGHILRSAALAARIAELHAGSDPRVGEEHLEQALRGATPVVIEVLNRYPRAPLSKNRAGTLMNQLDASMRRL